jgi:hypothetical protein
LRTYQAYRFLRCPGFSGYLHAGYFGDEIVDPGTHNSMVVDYKNFYHRYYDFRSGLHRSIWKHRLLKRRWKSWFALSKIVAFSHNFKTSFCTSFDVTVMLRRAGGSIKTKSKKQNEFL